MPTIKNHSVVPGSFFIMLNRAAQDPRLSADALAVLTYIMSLPSDWRTTIQGLQNHFSMKEKGAQALGRPKNYQPMGRDRVRQAINLLRELGYISRVKIGSTEFRYNTYGAPDLNPHPEVGVKVVQPKVGSSETDIKVGSSEVGLSEVGSSEVGLPDHIQSKYLPQRKDQDKGQSLTKAGAGFSEDSDAEMTIVDRLIDAIEAGRGTIVKGEMRQMGVLLPWRLNSKNSNSASNFDPRLLDRVLKHLRGTSSGSSANLGSAAMWIANRETDADGLRAINTFWEECQQRLPSPTPQQAPAPTIATAPDNAAKLYYSRFQAAKKAQLKAGYLTQLANEIASLREQGLENLIQPEWLKATEAGHAA